MPQTKTASDGDLGEFDGVVEQDNRSDDTVALVVSLSW